MVFGRVCYLTIFLMWCAPAMSQALPGPGKKLPPAGPSQCQYLFMVACPWADRSGA
jgi:hypothetical protein